MENMEKNTDALQKGDDGQQAREKTFTQEEVNRIVQDRLSREKESLAKGFEKREAAIKEKEALWSAKELLKKHELPEHFLDIVKDAEDQEGQVERILKGIEDYEKGKTRPAPYTPRGSDGSLNFVTEEEQRRFGLLK